MDGKNDCSKSSQDDNGGHNTHLSHDIIIYNILTRISSKDLYRFKCVCKLWNTSINDPLFRSLNVTKTSNPRGFISLEREYYVMPSDDTTTYNFVFFDFDKKEEKLIPFQLPEGDTGGSIRGLYIHIKHSFNSMLLISFGSVYGCKYFVYNLATASWLYMGTADRGLYFSTEAFLAYDPITLKYKVVAYSKRKFYILSDTVWSYLSMPNCLKDFRIRTFCRPVSVNYCLHWICRLHSHASSTKLEDDSGILIRLDTTRKRLSTIRLPVKDVFHSPAGLVEIGGLLWFFQSASDYHIVRLWYLRKASGNSGYKEDEWIVMCNSIDLITAISWNQLKRSTSISASARSQIPVLLDCEHNCQILYVMGPKCEIYVCSYDGKSSENGESSEKNDRKTNKNIHYLSGNNIALSTQ